jgi:hypothetical protein
VKGEEEELKIRKEGPLWRVVGLAVLVMICLLVVWNVSFSVQETDAAYYIHTSSFEEDEPEIWEPLLLYGEPEGYTYGYEDTFAWTGER